MSLVRQELFLAQGFNIERLDLGCWDYSELNKFVGILAASASASSSLLLSALGIRH